jgi:ribonuclease D
MTETQASASVLETTAEISELCDVLQRQSEVAVDTEGDSLHCYHEKLCLIQVSVPDRDALIDSLQPIDFRRFNEVLRSRTVVFHGCDYDLRMLRRSIGFLPGNVFDTYIAARLLGLPEVGLASLVKGYFKVEIPKSSQKANWAKRPLTPAMLAYAVNDTRYLLALAHRLTEQLQERGRWFWYEESCERAVLAAAEDREKDPEQAWKIAGSAALAPQTQAILRALWQWREAEAEQMDRPPFQIMRNEDLLGIARKALNGPQTLPSWLPGGRRRRLLEVLRSASQIPESEWPQKDRSLRHRPTSQQEKRFEALKARRDALAEQLTLDPGVLASRSVLEKVAREPEMAGTHLMRWQQELLLQHQASSIE